VWLRASAVYVCSGWVTRAVKKQRTLARDGFLPPLHLRVSGHAPFHAMARHSGDLFMSRVSFADRAVAWAPRSAPVDWLRRQSLSSPITGLPGPVPATPPSHPPPIRPPALDLAVPARWVSEILPKTREQTTCRPPRCAVRRGFVPPRLTSIDLFTRDPLENRSACPYSGSRSEGDVWIRVGYVPLRIRFFAFLDRAGIIWLSSKQKRGSVQRRRFPL